MAQVKPLGGELTVEPQGMRLAMTVGDPAGIGPEVCIKAARELRDNERILPVVYGPASLVENDGSLAVVAVGDGPDRFTVGKPDIRSGACAARATEAAVADALAGKVDAVVTAPINKKAFHDAGYHFRGQTEFVAHLCGAEDFAMMFVSESLRLCLVTTHLPINEVPAAITPARVCRKLVLFARTLRDDFMIPNPGIAVCALNPHSGERGDLGSEEMEAIIPGMKDAVAAGVDCRGPFPADALFSGDGAREFDGVLAMYHDQGLIPAKAHGRGTSVNITIGLPVVRTSPDFGSATDIAGLGVADHSGMVRAALVAAEIARNRRLVGHRVTSTV